jgi:uncharacterized membrane protein
MSVDVKIGGEVYRKLDELGKQIERITGKAPTIDEILIILIESYSRANVDPSRLDLLIDVWDRLAQLDRRVERLESLSGAARQQPPRVEVQQREARQQKQQEVVAQKPPVAAPMQPVMQKAAAPPEKDRFLEFMQNLAVYPLEKIRKPREQIDKLVSQNILEIKTVSGQEVVIYKPYIQELLKKLPLPIAEKEKLNPKEKRVLETLREAGEIVEDSISATIREV